MTLDDAKKAVKLWLDTTYEGDERHERRIKKLEKIWPYR